MKSENVGKKMQYRGSGTYLVWRGALALAFWFGAHFAHATELVYVPVNPNFGGSPLNGAALLNAAQAQNRSKDPDANLGSDKQSALEQFNESLQRSVLGRLASAATSSILGPNGQLVPGTVETGDFVITISDTGGGSLRVVTTDKITGSSTSFEVGQ
jgi:curli production assembly/transport component CsgF